MMLLIGSLSTGESIFALLLRGSNRTLICSCISVRRQPITCCKAAPYALLVSVSRQKCYGVTSGNSPFVILRSAHLLLRFYIVQEQFQLRCRLGQATSADIQAWRLKTACLRCLCFNIQKIHKNRSFHISISSSTPSLLLGVFYSLKSLFRLFVILTIAVIYLKLMLFIATYRQL